MPHPSPEFSRDSVPTHLLVSIRYVVFILYCCVLALFRAELFYRSFHPWVDTVCVKYMAEYGSGDTCRESLGLNWEGLGH